MSEVANPVFAYLYSDEGRVVTLAYTIFKDEKLGSVDTSYTAYLGYAICCPGDQHCKASGRRIAHGRMSKLVSRMEVPLGGITKRSQRLSAIVEFLCLPENTESQYGGDRLTDVALDHRDYQGSVDFLNGLQGFFADVHGGKVALDIETHSNQEIFPPPISAES